VRSGVFNRAFQDFAQQRIRNQANLERSLMEQSMGYDLGRAQAADTLQQQLLDLESEKAKAIEEDAQALMRYRAVM